MTNTLLYPYNYNSTYIFQNRYKLSGINITSVAAPKGSGFKGVDAGRLYGGANTGYIVSENYESEIDKCDGVLFCEGLLHHELYIDKIAFAQTKNKMVYVTKAVAMALSNEKLNKENLTILEEMKLEKVILSKHEIMKNELYDVSTPTIVIMGEGDECSQLNLELKLGDYFERKGYSVCQLGSSFKTEVFNILSIQKILSAADTLADKVILLNHYLYCYEYLFKPDLFILGASDAILPYNRREHKNFGESIYIIGNAVKPDISILNMYYLSDVSKEYIDDLEKLCKYRYGMECEYFFMANVIIGLDDNDMEDVLFLHITQDEVKDIKKCKNVYSYNDMQHMFDNIFLSLTDEIESV